jgi:hypothetical protein
MCRRISVRLWTVRIGRFYRDKCGTPYDRASQRGLSRDAFDHTASMSWKALYSATGIRVGSPTMRLILRLLQTRQTRSSLAILHGVSRSYPCRQVPRSGARHPGAASAKTSNPGPSSSHSRMELRRRHSAPAAVHRSGHCRSTRRQRISKKGNVIGNQRL